MSYEPEELPNTESIADLTAFIGRELRRISNEFNGGILFIKLKTVAPVKPREGDVAYADGTLWNPGAGKGIYAYISGIWSRLN